MPEKILKSYWSLPLEAGAGRPSKHFASGTAWIKPGVPCRVCFRLRSLS